MGQEQIAAIRAVFDQFAVGDFSAYEALPDEVELTIAPEMPDAGTYRGEEARRWLKAWGASFERLTFEAVEFIDAGDRVLIEFIQRGSPRGSTSEVEVRSWSVYTFREDILVRIELFLGRDEAARAAGLEDRP